MKEENLTSRISSSVADAISKRVEYIKMRSLDNQHYEELVIDLLKEFGSASRKEIDELLWDKLSDALNPSQKKTKIGNLLNKLRESGRIQNAGSRHDPKWQLTSNSE